MDSENRPEDPHVKFSQILKLFFHPHNFTYVLKFSQSLCELNPDLKSSSIFTSTLISLNHIHKFVNFGSHQIEFYTALLEFYAALHMDYSTHT